jgi:hypothetical protein
MLKNIFFHRDVPIWNILQECGTSQGWCISSRAGAQPRFHGEIPRCSPSFAMPLQILAVKSALLDACTCAGTRARHNRATCLPKRALAPCKGRNRPPGHVLIGRMHAFGVRPAPLLPGRCSERPLHSSFSSALAESVSCKRPSSGYQPSPHFRFPAIRTTPISPLPRHRRFRCTRREDARGRRAGEW